MVGGVVEWRVDFEKCADRILTRRALIWRMLRCMLRVWKALRWEAVVPEVLG